jgi:hypothetical protein
VTDAPSHVDGRSAHLGEQRGLPDAGRTADEDRAAPTGPGIEQGLLQRGDLPVAADQARVAGRRWRWIREQPVTQGQRFASRRDTSSLRNARSRRSNWRIAACRSPAAA